MPKQTPGSRRRSIWGALVLAAAACASAPDEIEVRATPEGLWVDGEPCAVEALEETLMAAFQRHRMRVVRVRYAEGAALDVERILGAVDVAGAAVGVEGGRALTLEVIPP